MKHLPKAPLRKIDFRTNMDGEVWGEFTHAGASSNLIFCLCLGGVDTYLALETKKKGRIYLVIKGQEHIYSLDKRTFTKSKTSIPFPEEITQELRLVTTSPTIQLLLELRVTTQKYHEFLQALKDLGYKGPKVTFDLTTPPNFSRVNL